MDEPSMKFCQNQAIVHVEDSGMVRSILRMACKGGVTSYATYKEAMGEVWAHKDADLLLIDITLEDGNSGVDYAKRLLKLYPECASRIRFLSAAELGSEEVQEALKVAPVLDKKVLRDPTEFQKHICKVCVVKRKGK